MICYMYQMIHNIVFVNVIFPKPITKYYLLNNNKLLLRKFNNNYVKIVHCACLHENSEKMICCFKTHMEGKKQINNNEATK